MPKEKEILAMVEDGKKSLILEVDLKYPFELHGLQNSYPLTPKKRAIHKELMSSHQTELMRDLPFKAPKDAKQLLTLQDKTNYLVQQGIRLRRVHKVLELEWDCCWIKRYIEMNTEFRKKAQSDFEKNFYKLTKNSLFGKMMENLRKLVDIKLVKSNDEAKIKKKK